MKKLVLILLTVCISLSFAAALVSCGQPDADDTEPKTTVTESEWNAAFALTNATASGFLTENGEQEAVTFKIADTAYYSENDGFTAWCIEKDGGWYMYSGTDAEGQLIPDFSAAVSTILMSFHLPEYASFSYDEQTCSYVCTNDGYPEELHSFNVYFEDGRIVKFEARSSTDTVTYSFNFTAYGSTVIDLPEHLR